MSSIIFGPIQSRRFGKSLGIDLSPNIKQCNYDCVYCELAPAQTMAGYQDVLPVSEIIDAVRAALALHGDIDVLTITANGEPTLYPHLLELIHEINRIKGDTKTLILSNGSTISDPKVSEALLLIDTVKLSLDCATQRCLKKIDRIHTGITIETIWQGMLDFKARTTHPLIIEILIVAGINDKESEIEALNRYLLTLQPERIDLGTIDRPPAYRVEPIGYERLRVLSLCFDPMLSVHITQRKQVSAKPSYYDTASILSTLHKRPLTADDIAILFDKQSQERLQKLLSQGEIVENNNNGVIFYKIP
jgi:wyosine [tRNA(Phe)-imidazoG37] synthetase (radical SAM superfamily)